LPEHQINIGIIGFGGFGQFLFNAWKELPQIKVRGISDLKIHEKDLPDGIVRTTNWVELVEKKGIDLIAIVVEPALHKEIAVKALENAKHVFIEKPLALNAEDAKAIIDARDRYGCRASVDYIMRFNPLLNEIRSWYIRGYLGKMRRIIIENYAQDEQLPANHWFWDTERSGGILIEHGVHFIDLVNFISGEEAIRSQVIKADRANGITDRELITTKYKSGLLATHFHQFSRPGFFEETTIRLVFDLGAIELKGWIPLEGSIRLLVNEESKHGLLKSDSVLESSFKDIAEQSDESRPKGWGMDNQKKCLNRIRSGGLEYDVSEIMISNLSLGLSKDAVYKYCVKESLMDLVHAIKDPEHELRADLEAGLNSLKQILDLK
jgi:predicted dehydrogenase